MEVVTENGLKARMEDIFEDEIAINQTVVKRLKSHSRKRISEYMGY